MNTIVIRITILAGLAVALLVGNPYAMAAAPEVNIAQGPLFSGRGNIHPNLLLNLSVEFPTVGAAYLGGTYADYVGSTEYIGYFNPQQCYTYPVSTIDTPTYADSGSKISSNPDRNSTPLYANIADAKAGQNIIGYMDGNGKTIRNTDGTEIISVITSSGNDLDEDPAGQAYFSISKPAIANHECAGGDSFSGNFLNWASASAIDMLRLALTGGDRVIDEAARTVLQRAYLPDGNYNGDANFYNNKSTYFPSKSITTGVNKVTPFSASRLYIVSCRNRILFSSSNTTDDCTVKTGGGADRNLGEYLARVQVCDTAEGSIRTDLCQKYGGNYKPVGELQRNADKIRVGAMGYLTGEGPGASDGTYGGVVRAPMKYVGSKKFAAPSYAESTNDNLEWDASTGVFFNNPEDSSNRTAASNSGVINYLNKFGRTNLSRLGAYKNNDPVSELYYEGIRYLQYHKGPTPESISSLGTGTTDDNFPVVKTWIDPVIASCQNNYILTIADIGTHSDRYIPGNTITNSNDAARLVDSLVANRTPVFDVMDWTKQVGAMETAGAGNSATRSGLANLQTANSSGGSSYYIAGAAYWANTNDIRLDKPVRVKNFIIDVDQNGGGLTGIPPSLNDSKRSTQLYLAAKYGGFKDKNTDKNPFKTFGTDGTTIITDNKEWDADNNNVPDNYFLGSQPKVMIDGIKSIFATISANSGTISGVTLTSTKVSTDSSFVYQPGFDPSKWSGNLLKLKLQLVDDAVTIQDSKFPSWDAGLILTGKAATTTPVAVAVAANPTPNNRKIYTSKVELDGSISTVPFSWSGGLTADQKALIDNSPVTAVSDGLGEKRVNYLRGSRADEIGQSNGIFRQRDRVLGDIINSNPTYVAAPAANIQGDDYQAFYEAKKDRTKAVYVGANDGMLHAFNAANGEELFAYVPNAVIPILNKLTDPNYVHRPYVDGTLTVREAKVGGSWKTILASGMGGGAQGVFVLNVTNPLDFSSGAGTGAIWEFTDKNDVDMGNLISPPQVAKFNMGVDAITKAPIYKYFVVVPSGLNNYKNDGASGTSEGALFLLSLDKNPADAWVSGTNYFKVKTPVAVADADKQNGLSSPALVLGNDGAVRYAYAGDLQGNMWRFDFSFGKLASNRLKTPMFTAIVGTDVQPITGQPSVVTAPGGGYVVLFGTGKYVEDADAAAGNFKTQSFYGVLDDTLDKASKRTRSDLIVRTLTKNTGNDAMKIVGENFTYGTSAVQGWYLDFKDSDATGERSVTNPLVAYGRLFFNSLVTGSDPCATGGGRTYSLNALTGLPLNADGVSTSGAVTGETSTVGMLSSPVLFDIGTEVKDRDSIGKRAVNKKFSVFNFGTGGKAGTAAQAGNGTGVFQPPAGRMSWREILNWQELHNDAKNK
ncbi:MAG: pilus assembly protein [Burkholderiaceae bacterium]